MLYQEPKRVAPSARRVTLSSKLDMAGVIARRKAINPYEKELGTLMDRPRILLTELKVLIEEALTAAHLRFMIEDSDRHHTLNRATKREMLQWIADHWENYDELFTQITVTQRTTLSFAADQRRPGSYKSSGFADD
jgi:hypothetical protein